MLRRWVEGDEFISGRWVPIATRSYEWFEKRAFWWLRTESGIWIKPGQVYCIRVNEYLDHREQLKTKVVRYTEHEYCMEILRDPEQRIQVGRQA